MSLRFLSGLFLMRVAVLVDPCGDGPHAGAERNRKAAAGRWHPSNRNQHAEHQCERKQTERCFAAHAVQSESCPLHRGLSPSGAECRLPERHLRNVDPGVNRTRNILLRMQVLRSEEHTSELRSLMRISCAIFCLKK